MTKGYSGLKFFLLAGVAGAMLPVGGSGVAHAQTSRTVTASVDVNVPAGNLSDALMALGSQAKVQIAFLPDRVAGRKAKRLRGRMTVEQALGRLLAGSGLRYTLVGTNSYVVGGPTDANYKKAQRLANDIEADGGYANGQANIPEILVQGRRTLTLNTDIPRSENEAQPYTVFTREQIKRSGSINLEDFFRDFLGANVTLRTGSQGGGVSDRDSTINLRGLGLDSTLILVDGRRYAEPNSAIGSFSQSSIAGIPLEQVERVEVLASSAAGQYGSNAVGGVVNIILRRDFKGVEVGAYMAASTRFDADEYRLNVNGTFGILPKTSLTVSGSWKKSYPLYAEDRSFVNDRIDHILENVPGYLSGTELIYGSTPNIRSRFGIGNLVLKPQYAVNGVTNLGAVTTFVPEGFRGVDSDGAAALLANAGRQNTTPGPADTGGLVLGDKNRLLNGSEAWNGSVTLRSDPLDWLGLYASGSYSKFRSQVRTSVVPSTVTLLRSSAFNPFDQDVEVTFPSDGNFETRRSQSRTIQVIGGAIVKLPWSWQANFDVNASWGRASQDGGRRQISPEFAREVNVLGNLDVIRDTLAYPVDFEFDTEGRYSRRDPSDSSFTSYTVKLAGPLSFARLPGGKPIVTLVAEKARQALGDSVFISNGPLRSDVSFAPKRSQKTKSVYGEIVLPIVGELNKIPLVSEFELRISGRYDDYAGRGANSNVTCISRDVGVLTPAELEAPCPAPGTVIQYRNVRNDAFNPVVAAKWSLTPDVALRGSYSTGYTPPQLGNVVETVGLNALGFQSAVPVTAVDPERGNERIGTPFVGGFLYLVEGLRGGNADVEPQKSESWSFGTILTPRFLPGLTARADWTQITIRNAYYQAETLLNGSGEQDRLAFADFLAAYPERFIREAPAPGDPFGVGKIVFIDATTANLSYKRSEALDFSLDYVTDIGDGTLRVRGNATRLLKLETRLTPSSELQDRTGVVSANDSLGLSSSIKLRGSLNVGYSRDRWNVGATMRYFGSYHLAFDRGIVAIQGAAKVPGQALFDLNGAWEFREGTELSGGIRNIFDKRPPIDVTRGSGFAPYGDVRLRNFYVNLTQRF